MFLNQSSIAGIDDPNRAGRSRKTSYRLKLEHWKGGDYGSDADICAAKSDVRQGQRRTFAAAVEMYDQRAILV
jgi:hypothetical protein